MRWLYLGICICPCFVAGCSPSGEPKDGEETEQGPLVAVLTGTHKFSSSDTTFLSAAACAGAQAALSKNKLPALDKANTILQLDGGGLVVLFGNNGQGKVVRLELRGIDGWYEVVEVKTVGWDDVPKAKGM